MRAIRAAARQRTHSVRCPWQGRLGSQGCLAGGSGTAVCSQAWRNNQWCLQSRLQAIGTCFGVSDELRGCVGHRLHQQLHDALVVRIRRRCDGKEARLALADPHLRCIRQRCSPHAEPRRQPHALRIHSNFALLARWRQTAIKWRSPQMHGQQPRRMRRLPSRDVHLHILPRNFVAVRDAAGVHSHPLQLRQRKAGRSATVAAEGMKCWQHTVCTALSAQDGRVARERLVQVHASTCRPRAGTHPLCCRTAGDDLRCRPLDGVAPAGAHPQ